MTRQTAPIQQRVDLQLCGAEDELNPLTRLRVRNVVAAPLEAEEPITRHDT